MYVFMYVCVCACVYVCIGTHFMYIRCCAPAWMGGVRRWISRLSPHLCRVLLSLLLLLIYDLIYF